MPTKENSLYKRNPNGATATKRCYDAMLKHAMERCYDAMLKNAMAMEWRYDAMLKEAMERCYDGMLKHAMAMEWRYDAMVKKHRSIVIAPVSERDGPSRPCVIASPRVAQAAAATAGITGRSRKWPTVDRLYVIAWLLGGVWLHASGCRYSRSLHPSRDRLPSER